MTEMTTWLKREECHGMFGVSNAIADAMFRWRKESGDSYALAVDDL